MIAKGFRGKYFTLQAITATVSAIKLQALSIAFMKPRFERKKEKSEEPPPSEDPLTETKPCYCNLFFACLAHKVLRLAKIKKPPLCRCRKTKSGIAPPLL